MTPHVSIANQPIFVFFASKKKLLLTFRSNFIHICQVNSPLFFERLNHKTMNFTTLQYHVLIFVSFGCEVLFCFLEDLRKEKIFKQFLRMVLWCLWFDPKRWQKYSYFRVVFSSGCKRHTQLKIPPLDQQFNFRHFTYSSFFPEHHATYLLLWRVVDWISRYSRFKLAETRVQIFSIIQFLLKF